MVEIQRESYLQQLERFVESPVVTVIVGLRRVGKSVLLRQFCRRRESRARVVYIDKEDLAFSDIRTGTDLVAYVDAHRQNDSTYVVIDEVQQIEEWERAVASLNGRPDTRIVISGSNSDLLAGELATRLAGRYVTIRVLPLSLAEFAHLFELTQNQLLSGTALLERYRELGGLPGLLHTDLSEDVVAQMQRDVYHTIALRDVVSRHRIRDIDTFEAVTRFAMDNVGNLVSAKSISDFLKSARRSGSPDTVLNYLAYLAQAYVLDRVDRYDIKGKRHLEINSKYYLGDLGLRSGLLGAKPRWIAGDLENLVYHELLRRGYRVSIGVAGEREIDFVAQTREGPIYIQVAYLLESRQTLDREIRSLLAVTDAYPKYVVSMDPLVPGEMEGIRHIQLLDFCMGGRLQPSAE